MTARDELRTQCIEAMRVALRDSTGLYISARDAERAFDALYGIARVVPPEATEEMLLARTAWESEDDAHATWRGMAVIGDLTNAPKDKS